jgi:hypothetical protein
MQEKEVSLVKWARRLIQMDKNLYNKAPHMKLYRITRMNNSYFVTSLVKAQRTASRQPPRSSSIHCLESSFSSTPYDSCGLNASLNRPKPIAICQKIENIKILLCLYIKWPLSFHIIFLFHQIVNTSRWSSHFLLDLHTSSVPLAFYNNLCLGTRPSFILSRWSVQFKWPANWVAMYSGTIFVYYLSLLLRRR